MEIYLDFTVHSAVYSLYSILSRWKAEGWIEKVDKNNWTKTQTLQSCNLA